MRYPPSTDRLRSIRRGCRTPRPLSGTARSGHSSSREPGLLDIDELEVAHARLPLLHGFRGLRRQLLRLALARFRFGREVDELSEAVVRPPSDVAADDVFAGIGPPVVHLLHEALLLVAVGVTLD